MTTYKLGDEKIKGKIGRKQIPQDARDSDTPPERKQVSMSQIINEMGKTHRLTEEEEGRDCSTTWSCSGDRNTHKLRKREPERRNECKLSCKRGKMTNELREVG